ncbi:MAG: hypothetical protein HQL36_01300 [Alphaproteobacteria bacterium]|nr:hypothetical protein [Alphaproteobacteria bacterium]
MVKQLGAHVIVLARGENRCWDRFVFVKELMHIFDDPMQSTNSGDSFDRLLTDLTGANSPEWSPQMISEVDCFWMALGALCPERERLKFQKQLEDGQIDDYGIALQLKIPQQYVHNLFRPNFPSIINKLVQETS